MQISLHQNWKLAHIMALALIVMVGSFVAVLFLPLPNHFFSYALNYSVIVPYVLITLPLKSVMQDPYAFPTFDPVFICLYVMVIYTFFFALVSAFVGTKKSIPVTYVGLYVVLAITFEKFFGHLL